MLQPPPPLNVLHTLLTREKDVVWCGVCVCLKEGTVFAWCDCAHVEDTRSRSWKDQIKVNINNASIPFIHSFIHSEMCIRLLPGAKISSLRTRPLAAKPMPALQESAIDK